MTIFNENLFTAADFLQIENTLYTPKEEEMVARRLLKVNTSFAPYASEVGYDYYRREGSAKILNRGASANDIPFVGEKGGRVTNLVYDIVTGIRYTEAERQAIAAKRALGKGPSIMLDTLRVATARRFILEMENKAALIGAAGITSGGVNYSVKGLLDSTFYSATASDGLGLKEDVAKGAAGSTDAEKRLWSNKTAPEILQDLLTAKEYVERDGLFKARALVLAPEEYAKLNKPYSTTNVMTILTWLKTEIDFVENIIVSRAMRKGNNGENATTGVNYFMVIDNDPECVEMALTYDLTLGNPVYDILNTMTQAVKEGFGGVLFRHPAGCYVGKGVS